MILTLFFEGYLNDCYTIVERLLKIVTRFLNDCSMIDNQFFKNC